MARPRRDAAEPDRRVGEGRRGSVGRGGPRAIGDACGAGRGRPRSRSAPALDRRGRSSGGPAGAALRTDDRLAVVTEITAHVGARGVPDREEIRLQPRRHGRAGDELGADEAQQDKPGGELAGDRLGGGLQTFRVIVKPLDGGAQLGRHPQRLPAVETMGFDPIDGAAAAPLVAASKPIPETSHGDHSQGRGPVGGRRPVAACGWRLCGDNRKRAADAVI